MSKPKIFLLLIIILAAALGGLYFFGATRAVPVLDEQVSEQKPAQKNLPVDKNLEKENEAGEIAEVLVASKSDGFLAPMDQAEKRISKKTFGMYITPETSPVKPDKFKGFHTGVDWEIFPEELEKDVPVRAVCQGDLILKKHASGYGGVVVQDCMLKGEPITVIYGHLKLASVEKDAGQEIAAGEVVGRLGDDKSFETDGARKHLHLAIHRGKNIELRGYASSDQKLTSWVSPCLFGCCAP